MDIFGAAHPNDIESGTKTICGTCFRFDEAGSFDQEDRKRRK
jgi:hypothetical protein